MPAELLQPIARLREVCKICGGEAELFGVADFNKNCEEHRRKVLPLSGVPLYYHRCRVCDFVFTTAFDSFTHDDFARQIYNDEYHLVDPDFASLRPQNNANWLRQLFAAQRPARTLDYGGGNGFLAEALAAGGFADVHVYDPFVPAHAARPQGTFDFICSFEVLEHSPAPVETMRDMVSLLSTPGVIVFSTLVRVGPAINEGINWWYIGPRNGHASIYSPQALHRMIGSFGMTFGSFNANMHIAFRELPGFAGHLKPSAAAGR